MIANVLDTLLQKIKNPLQKEEGLQASIGMKGYIIIG